MELKSELKKPYTDIQRADFVVENNHKNNFEIRETETGLEAWGITKEEHAEAEYNSLCDSVRAERDSKIDEIEWRVDRYRDQRDAGDETSDTQEQFQNVLKYMQDLRDVPEQEGFPQNVVWPAVPS